MAKGTMSNAHKQALAEGRRLAAKVRRYVEVLDAHRPGRGGRKTTESIRKQLGVVDARIETASGVEKVQLIQRRINLQRELDGSQNEPDVDALKQSFIESAKDYSIAKRLTYQAWRSAGVPAQTLREAGITPGFDPSAED